MGTPPIGATASEEERFDPQASGGRQPGVNNRVFGGGHATGTGADLLHRSAQGILTPTLIFFGDRLINKPHHLLGGGIQLSLAVGANVNLHGGVG